MDNIETGGQKTRHSRCGISSVKSQTRKCQCSYRDNDNKISLPGPQGLLKAVGKDGLELLSIA